MSRGALTTSRPGSFKEIFVSPIWYGVGAMVFSTTCNAMLLSNQATILGDQLKDNALLYNNIAAVTCSLVFLHSCPVFGYISQPHCCGRKWVLIFMGLVNCGSVAIVVFGQCAVWILISKVVLGVLGGGFPNPAYIATVQAWATDWILPHQKGIAFGFILGSLTFGMMMGGLLSSQISPHSQDLVLYVSFGISVAHPVFLTFLFPKGVPRGAGAATRSQGVADDIQGRNQGQGDKIECRSAIHLSSTDETDARDIGQVAKLYRDTKFVLAFLFQLPQRWVFIAYMLMGLTDTGLHDSFMLFLKAKRDFNEHDLSLLPMSGGASGVVTQFFLIPLLQACGFSPQFMMILGSLFAIGGCMVLAFVTDKVVILTFSQPLIALGYLAVVGALTILSKVSGPAGQNQGLLIGVATGVETLVAAFGPLGLALLLQHYDSLPHPFNFPGVGFAMFGIILIPAVWCSSRACLENWMETRKRQQESITSSLMLALIG